MSEGIVRFGHRGWCKQCRQFDILFSDRTCPECLKKNDDIKQTEDHLRKLYKQKREAEHER
jgi:Zn finger protein HypA/HybF involved in hydrogenase expression